VFERFTDGARQVVVLAQEESARAGHAHIGTEHLLVGLVAERDGVAALALNDAGLTLDAVRAAVAERLGPARLGTGDAAALAAIGIDLDRVRATVEAAFGPGALRPAARGRAGRSRHRRRPVRTGTPFTPRAKKVLELSLREALRLRHRSIGTEHLLLGLLREGNGLAVDVLVTSGASLERLRADVHATLDDVA